MSNKTAKKIIEKKVNKKRGELNARFLLLEKEYSKKEKKINNDYTDRIYELDKNFEDMKSSYENKNIELNSLLCDLKNKRDKIQNEHTQIEQEEIKRFQESIEQKYISIQQDFKNKEETLRLNYDSIKNQYDIKSKEFNTSQEELKLKINEIKQLRDEAQLEEKRLWDKLEILKDNLNSEQTWNKLWEAAFSKAIDIVWSIFKKETIHLAKLSFDDGYVKAEEILKIKFDNQIKEIEKNIQGGLNIVKIMSQYKEAKDNFLSAGRNRDANKQKFYEGQISLIEEVIKK